MTDAASAPPGRSRGRTRSTCALPVPATSAAAVFLLGGLAVLLMHQLRLGLHQSADLRWRGMQASRFTAGAAQLQSGVDGVRRSSVTSGRISSVQSLPGAAAHTVMQRQAQHQPQQQQQQQ